jgi:hypothetical protein
MVHFQPADVGRCYAALHMAPPSSFGGYFANLVTRRHLLKSNSGYRLENRIRESLNQRYGGTDAAVKLTKLLLSLPDKVSDLSERTYLDEALICYKHHAFRAAIVMTWNLAYYHLCRHVIMHRLADFNKQWPLVYQGHHKKRIKSIATIDDFAQELKESEVIEICNSAGILTKDVHRILVEKLGKRNSAAHPSSVKIGQLQVDEFIDDLVNNVVLKLT